MTKEKMDRINQLAKKAKTTFLSQQEKDEQAQLRKEYIDEFKSGLVSTLENTYIVDPDGNKTKVQKKH